MSATDPTAQRCFGAASRDPLHPCTNPALRLVVIPTPRAALNRPNSRCTLLNRRALVRVCAFGVPAADARATIALLGDSHAAHWRAALAVVAARERWAGMSLMRPGCPYSTIGEDLRRELRVKCTRWKQRLPAWFSAHRGIHTLFVVGEARAAWVVPAGANAFDARVRGFIAAWRKLPRTITHVVVIRDTPTDAAGTANCIYAALARRRPPGTSCALPRSTALSPDPAATAVRRLRSPRFMLVDLTHFFCGRRRCYPVVGGALVHKDTHHLTTVFATTLGPYLARALKDL